MKKLIIGVLAVIALLVLGLCVAVAMQPNDYRVVRETTIAAPPDVVFAQVNDFHKWEAWSPWAKMDPQMKVTYSGPEAGKGASYSWVGNSDVGKGSMTITDSQPPNAIKIDLNFLEPFESKNLTEFTFRPEGDKTKVTWSMAGQHNLMSKAMCLVTSMDSMVGPDFEKGLAQMKSIAESQK